MDAEDRSRVARSRELRATTESVVAEASKGAELAREAVERSRRAREARQARSTASETKIDP